jgi:hypothetical protein
MRLRTPAASIASARVFSKIFRAGLFGGGGETERVIQRMNMEAARQVKAWK